MKEGFLPGDQIYYRTNTKKEGRNTLLFIHGLSGSSSAWAEFEEKLGDQYNIIAIDLRGHGKSWKPIHYEEYEIKHFAQDIEKAVEYFKVRDPIIVSHSFGTLIVLEYLCTHKHSVRAAILLSPSAYVNKGFFPKIIRPLLRVSRIFGMFRPSQKAGSHINYKIYPQKGDWDIGAVLKDIKNTSMRVYLYSTEQSFHVDFRSVLKDITVPILLVHGRNDGIFPVENSLNMAKEFPRAKVAIIDGADHIIVKNNVPEVLWHIDQFVRTLSNRG